MSKINGLRANRNTTSLNDNEVMDFAFAIPAGTEATYLGYREARMKNVDGSLKSCTEIFYRVRIADRVVCVPVIHFEAVQ